jgi:hypothetical protein
MKTNRVILCIIFCIVIIGCKAEKLTNEEVYLQNDVNNDINISNFLNENRQKFLRNGLKGISSLHLSEEQEIFYNNRLDFFIAILGNNEKNKKEYYNCANEYYKNFPINSRYYYFWSKDVFDFRLFYLLENEFGEIKFPISYFNEFCSEIDMNWEYEIDEK